MDVDKEESTVNVKAKAILADSASLTVLWMNESALEDLPGGAGKSCLGLPLEKAVPASKLLGIPEAAASAAETGEPRHLRTNLISTARGTMFLAASVYPLPDGKLLLLLEKSWQAEKREKRRT